MIFDSLPVSLLAYFWPCYSDCHSCPLYLIKKTPGMNHLASTSMYRQLVQGCCGSCEDVCPLVPVYRIGNFAPSWLFMGVTWVTSLLSAIISQDAVGAPRSTALKSEFISCCSAQLLRIHHFVTFLMRTGEMCLSSRHPCVAFTSKKKKKSISQFAVMSDQLTLTRVAQTGESGG